MNINPELIIKIFLTIAIIATILIFIIIKININKKNKNSLKVNNQQIGNISANVVNISNPLGSRVNEQKKATQILTKESIRILFIDDKEFEVVKLLKKIGWKQVKRVKDIMDLNLPDLVNADIVFIDIQGVGKTIFPDEEGFGLCREIKKKYPDKLVIIYSAEQNRLNNNLTYADRILDKNTNPHAFMNILDEYIVEKNENRNNR